MPPEFQAWDRQNFRGDKNKSDSNAQKLELRQIDSLKLLSTRPWNRTIWEVLNGVGVDGVGVIFPFLLRIFPLFLRIFPLFLRFALLLLKDKGKQQQFTAKMGNFTPTPSAPTPCKTSRTIRIARF